MAKQMRIIGSCPFCQREVGSDMRPINQLNMEHINILANELKDLQAVPSNEDQMSQRSTTETKGSNAESNDAKSVSILTETMLNLVKEEFERPPNVERHIPGDHAELILAMLSEEQNSYEKFLQNESSTRCLPKRARK